MARRRRSQTKKTKSEKITVKHDSFEDFLTHIGTAPKQWQTISHSDAEDSQRTEFTGTKTYADAQALATNGWPEGRERFASILNEAATLKTWSVEPSKYYDVAGAYPDAALAAAGAPDCMITPVQVASDRAPILRLAMGMSNSGSTPTSDIENFGCAILSYIDRIENEGVRVELTMTMGSGLNGVEYYMEMVAKHAQEPLEIDRLAFMIAHPSMLRRLLFRAMEVDTPNRVQSGGYGSPRGERSEEMDDDIVFLGSAQNAPNVSTIEDAVYCVTAMINAETK